MSLTAMRTEGSQKKEGNIWGGAFQLSIEEKRKEKTASMSAKLAQLVALADGERRAGGSEYARLLKKT